MHTTHSQNVCESQISNKAEWVNQQENGLFCCWMFKYINLLLEPTFLILFYDF